jgi:predicted DNA-binding protein (MmcQ/YjbR family)
VGRRPTFRVNNKNFIFSAPDGSSLTVKLTQDEAAAVVESDPAATPCGYGLGRHGWITVTVPKRASATRWEQLEEWIRTSYTLVAPKRLARIVIDEDART